MSTPSWIRLDKQLYYHRLDHNTANCVGSYCSIDSQQTVLDLIARSILNELCWIILLDRFSTNCVGSYCSIDSQRTVLDHIARSILNELCWIILLDQFLTNRVVSYYGMVGSYCTIDLWYIIEVEHNACWKLLITSRSGHSRGQGLEGSALKTGSLASQTSLCYQ